MHPVNHTPPPPSFPAALHHHLLPSSSLLLLLKRSSCKQFKSQSHSNYPDHHHSFQASPINCNSKSQPHFTISSSANPINSTCNSQNLDKHPTQSHQSHRASPTIKLLQASQAHYCSSKSTKTCNLITSKSFLLSSITKPKPAGTLIQAWAADRVHPAITNPERRPKTPLNPIAVLHHRPPLTVTTDLTASSSDQINVVPLHLYRRRHPSCCSSLSPTHLIDLLPARTED
ncbi:hypothetical protein M0R45_008544 [Rubus argutus]|uniref:Uncharacterized protein n=1 Tax=Rubus argutus TaxID=59490 RepID=A0AAW1Y132_RUBAR